MISMDSSTNESTPQVIDEREILALRRIRVVVEILSPVW
jgi:hypothetical protein